MIGLNFAEIATKTLEKGGPGTKDLSPKPGDGLQNVKDKLNKYEIKPWVPFVGGTGVGDFWVGGAPSMYKSLHEEGPSAAFTLDYAAEQGTMNPLNMINSDFADLLFFGMDVTGVAGLGATAVAKGSKGIASKVGQTVSKATDAPTSASRRDFMKKSAAITGAAAVGVKLLKEGTEEVVKKSTDNVAAQVSKHKFNSLKEYNDYLNNLSAESGIPKFELALDDEALYDGIKLYKEKSLRPDLEVLHTGYLPLRENQLSHKQLEYLNEMSGELNSFSPQAKSEMKAFKESVKRNTLDDAFGGAWPDYLENSDEFIKDELIKR